MRSSSQNSGFRIQKGLIRFLTFLILHCSFLIAAPAAQSAAEGTSRFERTFADAARTRLAARGLGNTSVETADAMAWQTDARFDAVCVTGAVAEIPSRFLEWLAPNGRLFVIHGQSPVMEAALLRGNVNAPQADSLFETDIPYLVGGEPAPRFVL